MKGLFGQMSEVLLQTPWKIKKNCWLQNDGKFNRNKKVLVILAPLAFPG